MNEKDTPNNCDGFPSRASEHSAVATQHSAVSSQHSEQHSAVSTQQSAAEQNREKAGDPGRGESGDAGKETARCGAGRRTAGRKFTKDELIVAIQECVAELGHLPTRGELMNAKGITQKTVERNFGNYTKAFRAAGFNHRGPGYTLSQEQIFADWAAVVRKMGAVPTVAEYQMHSRASERPFRIWFGSWKKVPQGLLQFAEERGLGAEWGDVMEIAREHCRKELVAEMKTKARTEPTQIPRIREDWPLYGAPLVSAPLVYAPRNEDAVLFLFGAMAAKLGFMVLWVGQGFPDIEAIREVQPGLWQRKRIEVEYQSRNFLAHGHDPEGCDLIVCWEDNWKECPLEVVELKGAISN